MNKNRLASVLVAGASLALLAACNESKADAPQTTATASVKKTPHEVCTDEVVTTQKPVKDKDRVLGTLAGAVVGGVVGNKIGGHGTAQDIATVGGAAAGGYAGNRVQKSVQKGATEQTTQRVCHTEYD
ncbi:MAG TPA: glycine zipper 2TM domain-containing protein [Steroidobacteraceae bacterium]|nr:glycine zipper 2TM domain-containing protein [Steroidobacteraceae bacterium]